MLFGYHDDYKRVGTISELADKNTFTFKWIITDFQSLTKSAGSCCCSFWFATHSAVWKCLIFPNDRVHTAGNSFGLVSVGMQMETSFIPRCYEGNISVSVYSGETKHRTGTKAFQFDGNGAICLFRNILTVSQLNKEDTLQIEFQVELLGDTVVDVSSYDVLKDCSKSHLAPLSKHMKNIFLNQKYCDITINVNEQQFPAHKAILAARSPVFSAMFEHEMAENVNGEINITDCDPDVFHDFLLYIYSGELLDMRMTADTASQYYKLADKYDIKELKQSILKVIESTISLENICDILLLSEVYNEINLKQFSINFIVKNAETLFQSNHWKKFRSDHQNLVNEIYESAILKM